MFMYLYTQLNDQNYEPTVFRPKYFRLVWVFSTVNGHNNVAHIIYLYVRSLPYILLWSTELIDFPSGLSQKYLKNIKIYQNFSEFWSAHSRVMVL